ncbi:MAG: long-chain fatty acid--CoA ligase, partial [Cyanobacteriota bacterium]|nr:long-chain fatty acid--CoA ligase [Cyanobacteriota bacterium]
MSDEVAAGSRLKDDNHEGSLAKAVWRPSPHEEDGLAHQGHVAQMGRVDQIWLWLAQKHGQILAVDAPHA